MMAPVADPTARTLQLLDLLQSAHQRTVAELADRLGVDERTVRRDVRRLAAAGVDVESVRGRYGGYRLASGARVLPVTFTGEEAVAVVLGLARGGAAPAGQDVAAQTALSKVRRAMRREDAARGDAALGVIARGRPDVGPRPDPGVMLTLADAVASSRVVELRHHRDERPSSRRVVHPYGLVARERRWYLVASDTGTGEDRAFRVDRIRSARSLAETFLEPGPRDPASWLTEHFATADYAWTVVLHVRATEDHIRAHLPASVARLERQDAGTGTAGPPWHRAEIRAESLDWIPAVVAALGCEVRIERPDELRDRVRAVAARLLAAAADGTPGPLTDN